MQKNIQNNDDWPRVNSIVALNAGTRLDTGPGLISIVPDYEQEIIGIVLEHYSHEDSKHDRIDILIEDHVYHVMRTPSPHIDIPDYWNLREIHDDGTTTKF